MINIKVEISHKGEGDIAVDVLIDEIKEPGDELQAHNEAVLAQSLLANINQFVKDFSDFNGCAHFDAKDMN